jgi:hypothetical protein
VINAVVLAAEPHKRLTKKDCLDLFAFLACTLKLDDKLLSILIGGNHYPTVSRLLRAAHCWLVTRHRLTLHYRRPFLRKNIRATYPTYDARSGTMSPSRIARPSSASPAPTNTGPSSPGSETEPEPFTCSIAETCAIYAAPRRGLESGDRHQQSSPATRS